MYILILSANNYYEFWKKKRKKKLLYVLFHFWISKNKNASNKIISMGIKILFITFFSFGLLIRLFQSFLSIYYLITCFFFLPSNVSEPYGCESSSNLWHHNFKTKRIKMLKCRWKNNYKQFRQKYTTNLTHERMSVWFRWV